MLAIHQQVVHAPLPANYREIDDIVRESEDQPRRAAALARARQRMAAQSDRLTVATLRLRQGLSQTKVAELTGNSQSSYSLIESGRRDMLFSTFEKLCEVLCVSPDKLSEAIRNTREDQS